MSTQKKEPIES